MFVEDLRNDFYNVLLGNRVLLLVHYDVDAICTCKILQGLFKCDNISYTLVPIGGVSELKTAYEENNEEIKYVVLVNCGGTIDLVDILQPEEDVVFFVLDSHKPTDICNVYSDGQVRLVYKDSEENIPNFDDIFRDDDEDEEEQLESGMEALEAAVERRRQRRAWEERRHTLMFNYTQFSYYGKPSACVALDLAWVISRCGRGAQWAASVAAAAGAALCLRAPAQALLDTDALHRQLAAAHADDATWSRVVLQTDAWLPLYRVWSLEAALRHAPGLAPHLRLHTLAGAARLRQLLADMGFPLQQARQAYRSMDVELRRCLLSALETAAPKHKLPDPSRAAFLLHRPHCQPLAALDVAFAVLALIEHDTIPKGEGFQHALAALDIEDGVNSRLRMGFDAAMRSLEAVARLVNATLSGNKLHLAGPFSYLIVQETIARSMGDILADQRLEGWELMKSSQSLVGELNWGSNNLVQFNAKKTQGTAEARVVRGPLWLGVAARWAAAAAGGGRPVLASAPVDDTTCILLGIPPRAHSEPRNLFGAAFEQAATKSGASVSLDYLDSSVITLPTSQRTQFLDALTALLA